MHQDWLRAGVCTSEAPETSMCVPGSLPVACLQAEQHTAAMHALLYRIAALTCNVGADRDRGV